jgi:ABC-type xylose transport system permease subunit
MQIQAKSIDSKLRLSGGLIALGLLIQALSLLWNHPLSFVAFVTLGGTFVGIGILLYLLTVVNISPSKPDESDGGHAKEQMPQT